MPFAPHEIENRKFVVSLRGYNTDEVDSFLRAVAADYRAALGTGQAAPAPLDGALVAQLERALEAARVPDAVRHLPRADELPDWFVRCEQGRSRPRARARRRGPSCPSRAAAERG